MLKLIRKYQRWCLAIVGVILMVTFVVGFGGGGGRARPTDRPYGTAAVGGKVMVSEVAGAKDELSAVAQFTRHYDPANPMQGGGSLVDGYLGRDVAAEMVRRPELFVLLRREAVAAGMVADPQQVQTIVDTSLAAPAGPDGRAADVPARDSDAYQAVSAGVSDLLLVGQNFGRTLSAFKASRPAVDHTLASFGQSVQLNLVPVPAAAFDAAATPPSQDQQLAQFRRYADVSPDRPDPAAGNPFGFGYRTPTRSRVQYLRLTRDAVEKAVAATKSDYDWEVDARKLLLTHPDQFAPTPPPTTNPSAVPPKLPPPPFDRVRDQAIKAVRGPLVQALQDQVQQFLAAALARDFDPYAAAVRGGKAAPATPVGPAYDARGYLLALAQQAQAKFNVHVDTDETPDMSAKALAALPGVGTAYAAADVTSAAGSDGSLPGLVSDRATAYLAHAEPRPPSAAVELMRPSAAMAEADAVDFVRVASVAPSAPAADLDAVRPAVVADCRLVAAYDAAKAKADQLLDAARTGSTMPALADKAGLKVLLTQPLTLRDTAIDGLRPPLDEAASDVMTSAFGLLDGYDPVRNAHPAKVIPVPGQRRLFVAQLVFVNARWTAADYYQYRMAAASELRRQQAAAARLQWFDADAIVDRTGFKSANAQSSAGS